MPNPNGRARKPDPDYSRYIDGWPRTGQRSSGLTKAYRAWQKLKQRCKRPDYRDRGINCCDRWQSFDNFFADMGHPPNDSPNTSIDRIDNNGPYSPDNCRWADRTTQQNNRRANKYMTFKGETLTVTQWARRLGVQRQVLRKRLLRGWTVEQTLTTPLLK